jgi:hypothetical protein
MFPKEDPLAGAADVLVFVAGSDGPLDPLEFELDASVTASPVNEIGADSTLGSPAAVPVESTTVPLPSLLTNCICAESLTRSEASESCVCATPTDATRQRTNNSFAAKLICFSPKLNFVDEVLLGDLSC